MQVQFIMKHNKLGAHEYLGKMGYLATLVLQNVTTFQSNTQLLCVEEQQGAILCIVQSKCLETVVPTGVNQSVFSNNPIANVLEKRT